MGVDGGLHVLCEIGIGNWRVSEPLLIRLCQSDAIIDRTSWSWRRLDHRHRLVILLDDNLDALSNLFQHGVEIPSDFGLRHVDLCHTFHHTSLTPIPRLKRDAPALALLLR